MDLSIPGSTPNSPLTPVFGDNVQDLLGTGALQVNPSAIITVNSIADTVDDPNSGVITLRDAINQANADNGQDLIVFDRSVFSSQQTITLSGTELDITHNLDIIAPRDSLTGGDLVTVSGNNAERVFEIGSLATVSMDGLIVADGSVTGENGGGIKNSGTLSLDSSIVSNNSTTVAGELYNSSILTLVFSTLTLNQATNGGGVFNGIFMFNNTNGSTSVRNTIIAANLLSTDGINPDVSGTFTSNGYNLIGDGTGSTGFGATGDIVGTSDNPIDPRLAPLDFYGGSTQTIALLPDSPAIGAGDPTVLDTDPTTDQRGFPRRAADGSTGIGAFEFSV